MLIVLDQDKTSTGYSVRLLAGIFNISNPKTVNIGTGTNQVPKLTYVDDEILNGPFGDIRGLQIGDDNADTAGIVTDLPADAIIYADGINAHTNSQGTGNAADVKALLLRHRTKNFFWSGDGGLIASSTSTGSRSYPFKLGPYTNTSLGVTYPYYPVAKPDYGYGSASLPVYNSVLFANVMAWALRMAEENGINTP